MVLGGVGRNFGAGMTGGVAYVWDPDVELNQYLADTAPSNQRLREMDAIELEALIREHHRLTGSPVASDILDDWERQASRFWVLRASRTISLIDTPTSSSPVSV